MTKLTAERLREDVHYNPETGAFTRARRTSNRINVGDVAGTVGAYGYVRFHAAGKLYPAHRLAWLYCFGAFPAGEIDHINGDKTDNRISNLRLSSRSLNLQNQRKARATNKLGVLGVSPQKGRFKAQIQYGGKKRHIGMFETKEEAYAAYVSEKRKHHEACTI